MTPGEVHAYLRENVRRENETLFGVTDPRVVDEIAGNWFDDGRNYDGRWAAIASRVPVPGRILDMAAGCGTFLLYSLRNGRDAWGVEPEPWKRTYYGMKVAASGYPASFLCRLVPAVGEELPFRDGVFDLVTTYQTLEHVGDRGSCLGEMMRVLRPGGTLHIRAPDYRGFYEPHYRVLFFPRPNRTVAAWYLKARGRPVGGLRTLAWTTAENILSCLGKTGYAFRVETDTETDPLRRRERILGRLPAPLRRARIAAFLERASRLRGRMREWTKIGRQESVVELWVKKIG